MCSLFQKWQEQAALRWANGKRFADENFLSWRTLETMADLKHQYLELLMSIGFVTTCERMRRRPHEDRVLKVTPAEVMVIYFDQACFFFYIFCGIVRIDT